MNANPMNPNSAGGHEERDVVISVNDPRWALLLTQVDDSGIDSGEECNNTLFYPDTSRHYGPTPRVFNRWLL